MRPHSVIDAQQFKNIKICWPQSRCTKPNAHKFKNYYLRALSSLRVVHGWKEPFECHSLALTKVFCFICIKKQFGYELCARTKANNPFSRQVRSSSSSSSSSSSFLSRNDLELILCRNNIQWTTGQVWHSKFFLLFLFFWLLFVDLKLLKFIFFLLLFPMKSFNYTKI